MLNDIRATWALLVGIGFMMIGNGLQGTFLGQRAVLEGFSTFTTGVVMSGYYIGIFAGSILAPRLVRRVGHIRVFAALASLASIAILLHLLYINPFSWMLMRLVTGVSYAGLYVVTESWLNDRASNETRARMLSVYMVIVTLGLGGGQFMLNLGDPLSAELFILVSVLVSFGLIPILLTARPAPAFELAGTMTLRRLFNASPLGVVSTVLVGLAHGTFFALGAVYALQKGLSTAELSVFMACFVLGGLLLQWPLGALADYIERRVVIAVVSLLAVVFGLVPVMVPTGDVLFFVAVTLLGSVAMPMYSVCIAYANDRLEPEEIVAASGKLVMLSGVGLTVGPIITSWLMQSFGADFFMFGISGAFAMTLLYTLYRMLQRPGVEVEDQMPMLVTGQIGTPVAEISAPDAVDYVEAVSSGEVEKLDEAEEAKAKRGKGKGGGGKGKAKVAEGAAAEKGL